MAGEATIQLAHGLGDNETCERAATVRPIRGTDEVLLVDLAPRATHAARITALLAAATLRIGRRAPISADDVRSLSIGDRERLLLALYDISFGHIEAVTHCGAADCGEALELDLNAGELLASANGEAVAAMHEITVGTAPDDRRVCFRVPNGGDQEFVAAIAPSDPRKAADNIIRRCVIEVRGRGGAPEALEDVLPALRKPLADACARLDSHAAMTFRLRCPVCNHESTALLAAWTRCLRSLNLKRTLIKIRPLMSNGSGIRLSTSWEGG